MGHRYTYPPDRSAWNLGEWLIRRPLEYATLVTWWEAERVFADDRCRRGRDELCRLADAEVSRLPIIDLIWEESVQRERIESELQAQIRQIEVELWARLDHAAVNLGESEKLTQFSGWSVWDVATLATAGGTAGALATVGLRSIPGVLAMFGAGALATIAAPVTLLVGAGALGWSAVATEGAKRAAYRDAVRAGLESALVSSEPPGNSVLGRQMARLDLILQECLERHL